MDYNLFQTAPTSYKYHRINIYSILYAKQIYNTFNTQQMLSNRTTVSIGGLIETPLSARASRDINHAVRSPFRQDHAFAME
jgi:hypothetical protein